MSLLKKIHCLAKQGLSVCFCLCVILVSTNSLATTIDKIVVFGDSLSDNGNTYKRTIDLQKYIPFFPSIPLSPPYYSGQFSNGMVWTDHLASAFHFNINDSQQYSNYAYGGARAESGQDLYQYIIPSLEMQVGAYTTYYMFDLYASQHLYIVWIGANDYLNGQADVESATDAVIAKIQYQVEALYNYGARIFLIVNLPNFANTPYAKKGAPEFAHNLEQLAQRHNAKLATMIQKLQNQHPEIKIMNPDINVYFDDVLQHPLKYNIKNISEACYPAMIGIPGVTPKADDTASISAEKKAEMAIMANPQLRIAHAANPQKSPESQPPVCLNARDYLFWDYVHPTGVAHEYLARFMADILTQNNITS